MGSHRASSLTEMVRLVLQLSATGLLTDEVAERLGIAPDEVRRHVAAAMAALGARSKLEAVLLALRLGVITLPGAGDQPGPG